MPPRGLSRVLARGQPRFHDAKNNERRFPSPSTEQVGTVFAEVQMWMDPKDEVESRLQELQ